MGTIEIRGTFICARCGRSAGAGQVRAGQPVCYGCEAPAVPEVVAVKAGTRCTSCRDRLEAGQMSKGKPYCRRCAKFRSATGPHLRIESPAEAESRFERDWQAGRR